MVSLSLRDLDPFLPSLTQLELILLDFMRLMRLYLVILSFSRTWWVKSEPKGFFT